MVVAAQHLTKPLYSQAYLSDDVADLAQIYQPGINLCLIERQVDNELSRFVEHVLRLPNPIVFVESIDFASFDFFSLQPRAAHLPGYRAFCNDVAALTALYCDLFELKRVGLRLNTLDHAMCPKFHVDSVTCRLVCTYGGIGTEWLEDAYADRRKLGRGSGGLSDELSGLILDTNAIHNMPPYAIGLLKGGLWEGNEQHGAIHRSPKLTLNSPRRLLLTLDFG
ncbi:uncharacterized protein DUF1826 [Methylobacter tundripaludum]|uniref:Uncharacterized protein DUF1826 n=1 Tax=Methylobacter tundripaludum TaxID=173365 RepID=A0A2S6GR55_9GAMM|nr:DUF1826 domain-containing protein [Methylobacter tundripaludum]PPK67676.1 uncharacterized protein DUF1826 [Methylobacter tundripaludum]